MEVKKEITKIHKRLDKVENILSKTSLSKAGKLVKCKCGYTWRTQSKANLVSCPNCGNKTKIKKNTCFKCQKLIEKNEVFGYNSYFHKKCYDKFKKNAIKETEKGLKEVL